MLSNIKTFLNVLLPSAKLQLATSLFSARRRCCRTVAKNYFSDFIRIYLHGVLFKITKLLLPFSTSGNITMMKLFLNIFKQANFQDDQVPSAIGHPVF